MKEKTKSWKKYPYIAAWHRLTGSNSYYINNLIEEAENENAPTNAIYKDYKIKKWITIDEVTNIVFKEQVENYVRELLK